MGNKHTPIEDNVEEFKSQPYVSIAETDWTEENRHGYLTAIEEIEPWLRTTLQSQADQYEREKGEMVRNVLKEIEEHKVIDGLSFEGSLPPAGIFTQMMEDTNMIRANVNGVLDVLKEAIAQKYGVDLSE